jgi:hypothetical protein
MQAAAVVVAYKVAAMELEDKAALAVAVSQVT